MIEFLFVVMCVLCLVQPTSQSLFAASVFISITISYDIFLSDLDGFAYYGSCAAFDLLIVILISGINPAPKIILRLQSICIFSAMLNLWGWIIWYFYLPPDDYDMAFILLYMYTVIVLVLPDKGDNGGITIRGWAACLRFADHPLFFYLFKHKDQT